MTKQNSQGVIVIGGGPAGLMAAGTAASQGVPTWLLEKMPRLGRKLLLTGKGRCNLTNTQPMPDFLDYFPRNQSFLHSPLSQLSNEELRAFFESQGLETKAERGGRVFPKSDRSLDVLRVLEQFATQNRVKVWTKQKVVGIDLQSEADQNLQEIRVKTAEHLYQAKAVIVATGGLSYPATGSTGDGYVWAEKFGHSLIPLRPGLIPLEVAETWVGDLSGLTLKNVRLTAYPQNQQQTGKHPVGSEFGELLFTHFGLSGPIVLSLSSKIAAVHPLPSVTLSLNLKPALSLEQVDQRIQRDLQQNSRKQLKNSLDALLPQALIPVIIRQSGIAPDKFTNQITREERSALVSAITDLRFTNIKARPIGEAIITVGGVNTQEINPKTMASKRVPGLYFAGEVLDIDGYTGGFNLQAAFSTGYVAGLAAARSVLAHS